MKLLRILMNRESPLETRIAMAIPLPAWLAGPALALFLTATGLLLHWLSGTPLVEKDPQGGLAITAQFHVTLLCSVLLAYGLSAARLLGTPIDLGTAPHPRSHPGLLFAGLTGLLMGMLVIILTARQIRIQEPERNPWTLGEIYVDLLALLLLWGIARATFFTLRGAGSAGAGQTSVDLYDLAPLQRYGQHGLRSALAWSGGISLLVLIMFFDPNPALQIDSIKILGPILMISVVTAGLSLYQPLRILRKQVRREKSRAIETIHDQLAAIRAEESAGNPPVPGTEADLLARRAFVLSLPEWMLETGGFRKFAVFVLIPAGSWFVGPLLRKVLDSALIEGLARSAADWFR